MRKRLRRAPRHREHHIDRHAQFLRAAEMREARRIGNDRIGYERPILSIHRPTPRIVRDMVKTGPVARLVARAPTTTENRFHLTPPLLNRAAPDGAHIRHQARVLDHERHELCRVAADREELEPLGEDVIAESEVRGQPHAVAVFAELSAQRQEGLDVAAGADDLDDDVQAQREGGVGGGQHGGMARGRFGTAMFDVMQQFGKPGFVRAELDVEAAVICCI